MGEPHLTVASTRRMFMEGDWTLELDEEAELPPAVSPQRIERGNGDATCHFSPSPFSPFPLSFLSLSIHILAGIML